MTDCTFGIGELKGRLGIDKTFVGSDGPGSMGTVVPVNLTIAG